MGLGRLHAMVREFHSASHSDYSSSSLDAVFEVLLLIRFCGEISRIQLGASNFDIAIEAPSLVLPCLQNHPLRAMENRKAFEASEGTAGH